MQYVVVRDPDLQEIAAGAATATRTTSTTLFVTDVNDDNKLLEEIVVKFGVESVSNPTQRALRWDEITKTFNSLSLTLSGKTMTKDQVRSGSHQALKSYFVVLTHNYVLENYVKYDKNKPKTYLVNTN